jgi:hypothetical protein
MNRVKITTRITPEHQTASQAFGHALTVIDSGSHWQMRFSK